jgi:hypothetical protein
MRFALSLLFLAGAALGVIVQAIFGVVFVWASLAETKKLNNKPEDKLKDKDVDASDVAMTALIILNVAILILSILFLGRLINWIAEPLREWSPSLAVALFVALFAANVTWLVQALIILMTWGKSEDGRGLIRLGVILGSSEWYPFFWHFISYALMTRELNRHGVAVFAQGTAELKSWMLYALSAGINGVDSDFSVILPKSWTAIVPMSQLAIGLDLFFRKFTKLVLLAVLIKLILILVGRQKASEAAEGT